MVQFNVLSEIEVRLLKGKSDANTNGKNHASKDFDSLLFTRGFLAFTALLTSLFLIIYDSQTNIITADKQIQTTAVYFATPLLVGFCLLSFRLLAKLPSQLKIRPVALIVALFGTAILPFLLYLATRSANENQGGGFLIACTVVFAVGLSAMIYLWMLYVSSLNRRLLDFQLVGGVAFSAGLALAIVCLVTDYLTLAVLESLLLFLAWFFLYKTNADPLILKVTYDLSKRRAKTVKYDRWTYSIIGLNFGFALLLLVHAGDQMRITSPWLFSETTVTAAFLLPVFCASLLVWLFRRRTDYLLEKKSKDQLCVMIALPLIVSCFLPPTGQLVCALILLFVASVQMVIVFSASIEFLRSFLLSPAWYLAEDALVAISVGLGIGLAAIDIPLKGLLGLEGTLSLSTGILILANIIAQPFLYKGYYPCSSLSRLVEVPPSLPNNTLSVQVDEEPDEDDSSKKASWRSKILLVSTIYKLSTRQTEVVELLARGRNAQFISEYLFLSKATVKTHIAKVYSKLDIHSHQELLDIIESTTPTE